MTKLMGWRICALGLLLSVCATEDTGPKRCASGSAGTLWRGSAGASSLQEPLALRIVDCNHRTDCTVHSSELVTAGVPVLFQGYTASWNSSWSWPGVLEQAGDELLMEVKVAFPAGQKDVLYFNPSDEAQFSGQVNMSQQFVSANTTLGSLHTNKQQFQYLGDTPAGLVNGLPFRNHSSLYLSEEDREEGIQSLWLSSAGATTHLHFDSDYNAFVQLVGAKRWTLFAPTDYANLCPFPRVHPMWGKSKVDYSAPDLARCPSLANAQPYEVTVRPGDLLFVPAHWWHHVRSMDASASLTTYSRHHAVYDHMHAIYRYEAEFDRTYVHERVPGYMLRFFLQLCVHALYSVKERPFFGMPIPNTSAFFDALVEVRFTGLDDIFLPADDNPDWCTVVMEDDRRSTPTSQHTVQAVKFDAHVVVEHFEALPASMRDVLFADYVEELLAEAVGAPSMLSYVKSCFGAHEYQYTYYNLEGFWEQGEVHSRGKRVAWPGHGLKGELKKMNEGA